MYVVVRTPSNVLVTHGKLGSTHVRPGDRVVAGFRIGTSSGNLYIGVRKDGVYIDPNGCGVIGKSPGSLVPRAKLLPIHSLRP
jgi:septal ring factor EnvC (AmiA/AmiB activator)